MRCNKCGQEITGNGYFCPSCGERLYQQAVEVEVPQQKEKIGIGWVILSWFIPMAGLIIFLVKKEKSPRTAKASGITALISFILSIIVGVIAGVWFAMFVTNNVMENTELQEEITDLYEEDSEMYESQIDAEEWDELLDNIKAGEEEDATARAEESIGDAEVASEWTSYAVTVNGTTLTLPCSYQDVVAATGAEMKSADAKSYLESGYYITLELFKNDETACYIDVMNVSEGDLAYTDCEVSAIYQSEYELEYGADVIVFPGGLYVGMTMTTAELESMFGEPTDTYEFAEEDYENYTWTYSEYEEYTYLNCYEISITNGVIDSLYLDHSEY